MPVADVTFAEGEAVMLAADSALAVLRIIESNVRINADVFVNYGMELKFSQGTVGVIASLTGSRNAQGLVADDTGDDGTCALTILDIKCFANVPFRIVDSYEHLGRKVCPCGRLTPEGSHLKRHNRLAS